jgi:hypothetical protein
LVLILLEGASWSRVEHLVPGNIRTLHCRTIGNDGEDDPQRDVVGELATKREFSDFRESTTDDACADEPHCRSTSCSPQSRATLWEKPSESLSERGRDSDVCRLDDASLRAPLVVRGISEE